MHVTPNCCDVTKPSINEQEMITKAHQPKIEGVEPLVLVHDALKCKVLIGDKRSMKTLAITFANVSP